METSALFPHGVYNHACFNKCHNSLFCIIVFVADAMNDHKNINDLLFALWICPSVYWLHIFLHIWREFQQYKVEWLIFVLVPIMYILIVIIKLVLPLLIGHPVCWVHRFLWICVLWGLNLIRGFDCLFSTVFVGHCSIIFHIILCFDKTGRILSQSELEINAL